MVPVSILSRLFAFCFALLAFVLQAESENYTFETSWSDPEFERKGYVCQFSGNSDVCNLVYISTFLCLLFQLLAILLLWKRWLVPESSLGRTVNTIFFSIIPDFLFGVMMLSTFGVVVDNYESSLVEKEHEVKSVMAFTFLASIFCFVSGGFQIILELEEGTEFENGGRLPSDSPTFGRASDIRTRFMQLAGTLSLSTAAAFGAVFCAAASEDIGGWKWNGFDGRYYVSESCVFDSVHTCNYVVATGVISLVVSVIFFPIVEMIHVFACSSAHVLNCLRRCRLALSVIVTVMWIVAFSVAIPGYTSVINNLIIPVRYHRLGVGAIIMAVLESGMWFILTCLASRFGTPEKLSN